MPLPENWNELMRKANTYTYVDCQTGAEVEPPLEGPQHPYLLEIWQNLNGRKVVFHVVATFDRGYWYDMNANELGPRQVAMRWVRIADIASGWQTYTSLEQQEMMRVSKGDLVTIKTEFGRRGPYEVIEVEPERQRPYLINLGHSQAWVAKAQIYQGEEIED